MRHTGETLTKARNLINALPKGWLRLIVAGNKFYSAQGQLPDTIEARELGPTIAELLKSKYDYAEANYYPATNSIIVTSRDY